VVATSEILIVGGGPAGMVASLLFARAGLRVSVLEKHGDFLRDFRGDTVHPSTLRIFSDLGLLDRLLARPHDKVSRIGAQVGGRRYEVADFSGFDRRWAFIAMMPQWEFLDFVADEAARYPGFALEMETEATGLILDGAGRVSGVRCRDRSGAEREARARLTIACDGRRSLLRDAAELKVRDLGAPMDVFWFRIPKARGLENESAGIFDAGRIVALIDRGDYWQCAWVFAKGQAERVRGGGLEAFRAEVARAAPILAPRVDALASWDDVKLLTVTLDRLERWHRPGLLVIGDAAHAMSPIGGVGINVAVQDAVAAANILAGPMARGEDPDPLLGRVQVRRLPAVKVIQGFQAAAQRGIIAPLLRSGAGGPVKAPLVLRLLDRVKPLRRIPALLIGFGYRPERAKSDPPRERGGS
jgi:2-polyprenyl-6-methoxyphenol hydroxylase-like FAD-dependent oxidoreductase